MADGIFGSGIRQTHTYATLAVSRACFEEVRRRIIEAGPEYAERYIIRGDGSVIHWGGEIGLVIDEKEQGNGPDQA